MQIAIDFMTWEIGNMWLVGILAFSCHDAKRMAHNDRYTSRIISEF